MTFNKAKKLQRGDQVTHKKSGEAITIIHTDVTYGHRFPSVLIRGVGSETGNSQWHHSLVK